MANARVRARRPGRRAPAGTLPAPYRLGLRRPALSLLPARLPLRYTYPRHNVRAQSVCPQRPVQLLSKAIMMVPTSTLSHNPVYAFCPECGPSDRSQQIGIVFQGVPVYVPTALVTLTLPDAERLCSQLNARLGLNRQAWMKLAAQTMLEELASLGGLFH